MSAGELSKEDAELLANAKKKVAIAHDFTAAEIDMIERLRKPIFDPKNPPKTQDDIHVARTTLMIWAQGGGDPQVGGLILRALKETSEHIEMFGGEEGSEGGSRVLRLLPGMTLVERHDLASMPLRFEELKLLQLGEDDDIKHGVEPPDDINAAIVKYLGKPRTARTVYNAKTQDPEGLQFFTQNGVRTITYAELEARAKKRWARIRAEDKERAKNPPEPPVDDGELPLDLQG